MYKAHKNILALTILLCSSTFYSLADIAPVSTSNKTVYSPSTRNLNFVDATALNTYCILSKIFKSETDRDKCFSFAYNNESAINLTPIDQRLRDVESKIGAIEEREQNASNTTNDEYDESDRPEPAVKYVSVINNIINKNTESNNSTSTNGYQDFALSFISNDTGLMAGHVVEFSTTTYKQDNYELRGIMRAINAKQAVGVVDTISGRAINNNLLPVAFAGRVGVRVTSEGGSINMGDKITLSTSTIGVGTKLTGAGQSIGTALSSDNGSGFVLMLVKNEFIFDNNNINNIINNNLCSGQICLDQSMLSKLVNFINIVLPKLENIIK